MVQSPGLHVPLKEFRILIGNCELPVTVQMTILISKMVNALVGESASALTALTPLMLLTALTSPTI